MDLGESITWEIEFGTCAMSYEADLSKDEQLLQQTYEEMFPEGFDSFINI